MSNFAEATMWVNKAQAVNVLFLCFAVGSAHASMEADKVFQQLSRTASQAGFPKCEKLSPATRKLAGDGEGEGIEFEKEVRVQFRCQVNRLKEDGTTEKLFDFMKPPSAPQLIAGAAMGFAVSTKKDVEQELFKNDNVVIQRVNATFSCVRKRVPRSTRDQVTYSMNGTLRVKPVQSDGSLGTVPLDTTIKASHSQTPQEMDLPSLGKVRVECIAEPESQAAGK